MESNNDIVVIFGKLLNEKLCITLNKNAYYKIEEQSEKLNSLCIVKGGVYLYFIILYYIIFFITYNIKHEKASLLFKLEALQATALASLYHIIFYIILSTISVYLILVFLFESHFMVFIIFFYAGVKRLGCLQR